MVYFDLDGFKEVNDAYGHETGDRLLRRSPRVSDALSATVLARVGGDEFAVIIAGVVPRRSPRISAGS